MLTKLQTLEKIVSESQAMKVQAEGKKILLDAFTARAMLKVANALNELNKAKFLALDWPKMASVTWKLLK